MKAVKGNKVYTIDEMQKNFYTDSGFDILDDEGRVIAYGRGKMVPYGEFEALKQEKEGLIKECDALRTELVQLRASSSDEAERTHEREGAGKRGKTAKDGE